MKSLADYIYDSLFRFVDITQDMERKLNTLFNLWGARDISVDDFKTRFNFPKDADVSMLLDFMTEYGTDPKYTNFGKEENSVLFGK